MLNQQYYDAYNNRNPEGLANYYAKDAVLDDWHGLEAIKAGFKQLWAKNNETCTGGFTHFKVVGDRAVGWGAEVCVPKNGGSSDANRVEWISWLEKQQNGEWRAVREADNGPD